MQNKQWILNSFPVGEIQDNDLILRDSELNAINDGEVLIKNIYLSLDPANRGWMSGRASYVDAMKIGDIMRGGTIGIIKESKNEKYKEGQIVQYQGGLLSGMIDDTMALAFIFKTHFTKRPPTIEIKTNFLYPTRVGKAYGYGRIVKSGKNLVFLEGHLKQDDRIVVTATSTAVIVDMPTSRASILSKK